jgi:hypothetical protein
MPLSVYTAFPATGGTPAYPSQLSEIWLKSYTVGSGATSITVSDALFNLSTYSAIHVVFSNLTTTGATATTLNGGAFKNDTAITSGANISTIEGISSATATGWTTNSFTPTTVVSLAASLQLTPSGQNFANGISKIDVYINPMGMTMEFHNQDFTNARRIRSTVSYPSRQTFTSIDYAGMILGISNGSFTGGTVNVYGVK